MNVSRFSVSSCAGSLGHSCLSELSLSDVSNVSANALPILSKELWNHHLYPVAVEATINGPVSFFDAWYNPPAKVTPDVTNSMNFGFSFACSEAPLSELLISTASTQINMPSRNQRGTWSIGHLTCRPKKLACVYWRGGNIRNTCWDCSRPTRCNSLRPSDSPQRYVS